MQKISVDADDHKLPQNRVILLQIAITLCIALLLIETVGYTLTNSLALLTDSFHMLSDIITYSVTLFTINISESTTQSKRFGYGLKRIECLGATLSILLIWILTTNVIAEACTRIMSKSNMEVNAEGMVVVAILGITMNACLILLFNTTSASPELTDHDPESHLNLSEKLSEKPLASVQFIANAVNTRNQNNMSTRVSVLHALGDLICSIGVLVAAILIYLKPDYQVADPVCTLLFGVVAIITTIPTAIELCGIFMQASPPGFDFEGLETAILECNDVVGVRDVKIWMLDADELVCNLKIRMTSCSIIELSMEAAGNVRRICAEFGIKECHVEVEV